MKNSYSNIKDRDGYAWELSNLEKLDIPDTINGKLGLWNYENE